MLKAAAIQATLNTDAASGVLRSNWHLQPWMATTTQRYAEAAGLTLTEADRKNLRRFMKYVVWAGRYPVPTTLIEQRKKGEVSLIPTTDRVCFVKLFRLAEHAYTTHRAGANYPPRDHPE